MESFSHTKIGQIGEAIAFKYLKAKGYKILDKNFSVISRLTKKKTGEIDLIAKKQGIYIFIEVKAKLRGRGAGIPLEARINQAKKKRLIKTAEIWLIQNKLSLTTPRQIDIIIIAIDLSRKKAGIKHYKNAIEEIKTK